MFALKPQQHFPGQRVRQPEGDEVGDALAFDVRQEAARVDAAAEPIWRPGRNAGCKQGKLYTLEPGIAPFEVHVILSSKPGCG